MDFSPVFNIFEEEIWNVWTIMESHLVWHPYEDMKMSYAPSFSAPGGHILDLLVQ